MKFLLPVIVLALSLSACQTNPEKEKVTNSGTALALNGEDKNDSIQYTCTGCAETFKSKKDFDEALKMVSAQAKDGLKFPRTFKPKSVELIAKTLDSAYYYDTKKPVENTIMVVGTYNYVAKTAFGVEKDGSSTVFMYIQNGKEVDLSERIQLDSLKLDGKMGVNRGLKLYNDKGDFIDILPSPKDKALAVQSSLNCVDKGTLLRIRFADGTNYKMESWNKFNCEGNSYYDVTAKDLKELSRSPIETIYMIDGKGIWVTVPKNEADYFMQLVQLFK